MDPVIPAAELIAVVALTESMRPGMVNVGHSRAPGSIARAHSFVAAWRARGRQIGTIVSWPSTAASWRRPAARFAAGADTWVVADHPAGWRGMGPRLAATDAWRADRTVAFASLADPDLPRAAGREATDGLRGATHDGKAWEFLHGVLIVRHDSPADRRLRH